MAIPICLPVMLPDAHVKKASRVSQRHRSLLYPAGRRPLSLRQYSRLHPDHRGQDTSKVLERTLERPTSVEGLFRLRPSPAVGRVGGGDGGVVLSSCLRLRTVGGGRIGRGSQKAGLGSPQAASSEGPRRRRVGGRGEGLPGGATPEAGPFVPEVMPRVRPLGYPEPWTCFLSMTSRGRLS